MLKSMNVPAHDWLFCTATSVKSVTLILVSVTFLSDGKKIILMPKVLIGTDLCRLHVKGTV